MSAVGGTWRRRAIVAERMGMGGRVLHLFGGGTKNIKIKIRRGLKRLQNVLKNATINKKTCWAEQEFKWDPAAGH